MTTGARVFDVAYKIGRTSDESWTTRVALVQRGSTVDDIPTIIAVKQGIQAAEIVVLALQQVGPLVAIDLTTGAPVHIGTVVTDFRGEVGRLVYLERPNSLGRDGKVAVERNGDNGDTYKTYNYASVWNLRVDLH